MAAGEEYGIRLFGFRALMSLRLEKSYGTWYREYRPIYTLHEAGLQRYVKLDHEFIGRAAYEKEAETGPERRLVALVVEPDPDEPADVIGDEPIWHDGRGRRLGDIGRVRPPRQGIDRAGVRAGGAGDARRPRRERLRDRDHRAAPAGTAPARAVVRPAGSPDAPVTEVAPAAAEGAAAARVAGRIVVDGRPVAFEPGDSVAMAILRGGEVPGRAQPPTSPTQYLSAEVLLSMQSGNRRFSSKAALSDGSLWSCPAPAFTRTESQTFSIGITGPWGRCPEGATA